MKLEKVIINNEEIFLKKDFLGWHVCEPIQHPETKKFMWKNFLSKKGFVMLAIILLIVGLFYLGYKEAISNYRDVMKNPCKYCTDMRTEIPPEVYYGNLPNWTWQNVNEDG